MARDARVLIRNLGDHVEFTAMLNNGTTFPREFTGGAMGGVVFGQLVGYLLDHGYGYGVVFAIAGSLHVVAFATICLAIPRIQTLAEARA